MERWEAPASRGLRTGGREWDARLKPAIICNCVRNQTRKQVEPDFPLHPAFVEIADLVSWAWTIMRSWIACDILLVQVLASASLMYEKKTFLRHKRVVTQAQICGHAKFPICYQKSIIWQALLHPNGRASMGKSFATNISIHRVILQ